MTQLEFSKIWNSTNLTTGEKKLLEYNHFPQTCSKFNKKLFDLLFVCDDDNLAKMFVSFPEQVQAIHDFRCGILELKVRGTIES